MEGKFELSKLSLTRIFSKLIHFLLNKKTVTKKIHEKILKILMSNFRRNVGRINVNRNVKKILSIKHFGRYSRYSVKWILHLFVNYTMGIRYFKKDLRDTLNEVMNCILRIVESNEV